MKVIGVIPSRWGSTRFPGKSLYPILGKPLVEWVVEAAQRAKELDEVRVATDDGRIADALQGKVKVVMTSADHPTGTDRVAEAADAAEQDIVINIQGDEPLIDPALIDTLVLRMKADPGWSMATAATLIKSMADLQATTVVKVVLAADGGALYFSRSAIPCRRDGSPDLAGGLYLRHLGIYAYRGGFLRRLVAEPPCLLEQTESLEQLRALYIGGRIAVIQCDDEGVGVDCPGDVPRVEKILRSKEMKRV
ncbi:MAG: 3-deoxy-manno-octulosonate cytidylyltransferase [Kiritimatiellae bacterium]|nr:3-deoxy-manno-octulosonate cytidylyltransferase [Kiritimatiellia bacterium]